MVAGAYNGLELDQLLPKHKRKIYACLSDMNQILRKYDIKTWDDYAQISHWRDMLLVQAPAGVQTRIERLLAAYVRAYDTRRGKRSNR